METVLGLAFRGGQLYALEMSTTAGSPTPGTGAIVRVNRHGPPETIVSGLTFPTGLTVGPGGAACRTSRHPWAGPWSASRNTVAWAGREGHADASWTGPGKTGGG